jgi:GntR family transcriptional regulator
MQLLLIIRMKIENGEWPVGTQIPTEDELCRIFSVSRATVRTAVLELVRQGYLKRQQGKGTFICKLDNSEGYRMSTNLRETFLENSLKTSSSVLAKTVMMPVDGFDDKLNITAEKHIIYIKRLYSFETEPTLLQEIYIPYHICPLLLEDDIEKNSLLDLFDKKYGIKISKVRNYMEIAKLSRSESRILNVSEDSSAILLLQYYYSGDMVIMYTRSVKNPDRVLFSMELERKNIL